jgi:hypothetical protein
MTRPRMRVNRGRGRLPEPVTAAAAIARVQADFHSGRRSLSCVFGDGSGVVVALGRRVDELVQASAVEQRERASRVHLLAMYLAATCEVIEVENDDAADLRVLLDGITKASEFIAASAHQAAA